MGRRRAAVVWKVGSRLPHAAREGLARAAGWIAGWGSPSSVPLWEDNVERLTGARPTRQQRQEFIANWLRNNLMSLSLGRWSDEDVLRRVDIAEEDEAKLHTSLDGPGCILALPHMGSWDFAGAWCTRVGITVVSVAERLPDGLYERFRDARHAMGMEILPIGEPGLMKHLAAAVKAGKMVCLLSDRDLSGHGLQVDFAGQEIHVPPGPALLSRMTGADLRVAVASFSRGKVHLEVSDVIERGAPQHMMQAVSDHFARAAQRYPTSWLMLRKLR